MFDQDELDAWLWEVETTSKKVDYLIKILKFEFIFFIG